MIIKTTLALGGSFWVFNINIRGDKLLLHFGTKLQ